MGHLLRFLKGTIDQELHFKKRESRLQLKGYSDADGATDKTDRTHNRILFQLNIMLQIYPGKSRNNLQWL